MNDQSNPSQLKNFGAAPAQPSGVSRLIPHMRTLAAGGAIASLFALGAQKLLPDGWRPADILGSAAGSGERHEIEEKAQAKIDFERRVADAVAQAQEKSQTDLAAESAALQQRTQSLQTQSSVAGLADGLCFGAQIFAMLGSENTGADWHNGAVEVAHSSCEIGDRIRSNITQSQLDVVREVSVDRGAPTNDGAVKSGTSLAATTPVTQRDSLALARIMAMKQASRSYTLDDAGEANMYASTHFPEAVFQLLHSNLPDGEGARDVFVERVKAYAALVGRE